jgi:hypothetical protein
VRLARHLRRHDPKVRRRPNQVLLEVQRDARAGRPPVISPDEDFAGSINQERTGGGFIVAPQVQPAAGGQGQRGTNPAHRARREFTIFQGGGNASATAYHLKIGMAICSRQRSHLSWVRTQRAGADTIESYRTRVALSVPTLALSGLATRGKEECAAMSDGSASSAAEQVRSTGSLTDLVDEYRRVRGELERSVSRLSAL